MTVLKTLRNGIIGVIVIGVVAIFLYRVALPFLRSIGGTASPQTTNESGAVTREVSAVTSYEAPNGTDKVRFTLSVDSKGVVVGVKTTDALKGDTVSENLAKFSEGLLLVIRGKKLSELTAVDRIGKSSLTTAAFNAVLPALQRQL